MLATRDLVPLTLAAVLVAGVGTMIVQTRQEGGERAAAVQQGDAVPTTGAHEPLDVTPAESPVLTDAVPAPADMVNLGALPLRESVLPAPERDLPAIRRALARGSAGTYIGDMLAQNDSQLLRWPDRTVTALRVWVQPRSDVPHWDRAYPQMVRDVFPEWSRAGFPLRFLHVVDSAEADVHIVFTTALAGRRIGSTQRLMDRNGWLVGGLVTLATQDSGGHAFPAALVQAIARHEVGHVLGLDHAGDPTAVMYPETRTLTIGAADRATLHLLYTLPPGSVR